MGASRRQRHGLRDGAPPLSRSCRPASYQGRGDGIRLVGRARQTGSPRGKAARLVRFRQFLDDALLRHPSRQERVSDQFVAERRLRLLRPHPLLRGERRAVGPFRPFAFDFPGQQLPRCRGQFLPRHRPPRSGRMGRGGRADFFRRRTGSVRSRFEEGVCRVLFEPAHQDNQGMERGDCLRRRRRPQGTALRHSFLGASRRDGRSVFRQDPPLEIRPRGIGCRIWMHVVLRFEDGARVGRRFSRISARLRHGRIPGATARS